MRISRKVQIKYNKIRYVQLPTTDISFFYIHFQIILFTNPYFSLNYFDKLMFTILNILIIMNNRRWIKLNSIGMFAKVTIRNREQQISPFFIKFNL